MVATLPYSLFCCLGNIEGAESLDHSVTSRQNPHTLHIAWDVPQLKGEWWNWQTHWLQVPAGASS